MQECSVGVYKEALQSEESISAEPEGGGSGESMVLEGETERCGAGVREDAVSVGGMSSQDTRGPMFLAVVVVFVALCAAPLGADLPCEYRECVSPPAG